jgi:hypothetical protein
MATKSKIFRAIVFFGLVLGPEVFFPVRHPFLSAVRRLFPFVFLLFTMSLLSAAESSLPVVHISQEVHDLELDRETPKYVLVAGHITFRWKVTQLPGFGVSRLDYLNNTSAVEQTVVEDSANEGVATVSVAFRGRFECHNNFSAYPFNMPRVPVIFKRPAGNYVFHAPDLSRGDLQNVDSLSSSDSYKIIGRSFLEGTFYKSLGYGRESSSGDIHAVGLYLDTTHKPLRTIILILLPLLAIWGVSYSSQWWKEESASSRGVMASLFAAAAVAVASTNLAPNVSCPTAVILAFCCYYISLIILGVLTVMAFREKTRAHPEEFRTIRRIGRILGPGMLLVSVVFLAFWVRENRLPDHFEWLEDPVMISQAGSVHSPSIVGKSLGGDAAPLFQFLACRGQGDR